MSLTISRYKGGRNWAVREADTGSLVVGASAASKLRVTVYRKGAVEVVRRLTGAIPELPRRKRQRDFVYEAKSSQEVTS